MNKKKVVALIPTRLNSLRLPAKALLPINKYPLIIHVYKRAMLAKRIDKVFICCDHKKIFDVAKKYGANVIMTSKKHRNGTDRISEAYNKIRERFQLIVDIQGDEPLISPNHIDKVIEFHKKNMNYDIILPNLRIKSTINTNIVKLITNKKNEVIYISRANLPFEFKSKIKTTKKHLSIISFLPSSLSKYASSQVSESEKIEDIELLRAINIGLKIKTLNLTGDSFSIDVFKDYKKAQSQITKDKVFKKYR